MESKLINLSGGGYSAVINLNRGANCISLRHESGAVILREPEDPDVLDNPYLYGMPILFPVNRIDNGCFTVAGYHSGDAAVLMANDDVIHLHAHERVDGVMYTLTFHYG